MNNMEGYVVPGETIKTKKVGKNEFSVKDRIKNIKKPSKKSSIAGTVVWLISIALSYMFIHISCQSGNTIGYVNTLCLNGFGIIDYIGLICCAPIYMIIIVVLSIGFRG